MARIRRRPRQQPDSPAARPGDTGGHEAEAARLRRELAEVRTRLREATETIGAIRAEAARNQSLIENSMAIQVMLNADGKVADANLAAERVFDRSRAELAGTDFASYFTEPDRMRAVHRLVLARGAAKYVAAAIQGPDGEFTHLLGGATVYRELSGELHALVSAQDVTPLRMAEDALRKSEASLRTLVDNAPVGIVDVFPDGTLGMANPAYCQITGYTQDELREVAGLQEIDDPRDYPADEAQLRRMLSGAISTEAMTKRYNRKDGRTVWVDSTRALVRDDRGEPARLVTVVRDITEQLSAQAQIRELTADLERRVEERTAELERANRNLESFTYSVSHDLRAPLRALSGFSEVLDEDFGDQLGEEGRGYTQRIQAASERMAQLIDDLLLLSRVSRAGINPSPVDLSAEARAIAGQLGAGDPVRQVKFDIQSGLTVTADRDLIRTVLQNLLENAWKFTSRAADAVIEVGTARTQDGEPYYYVRDNGAGFDAAYADRLFRPFQRLHHDRDFPGTGIGLASVARVIDRHGGRTWAEGAVGKGATFCFTLPCALQPVAPGRPGLPGQPQGA